MLPLFSLAIFAGAGLLFLVQPMIAKQLLPLLGGSPAVWNTCMVFFQTTLLAGYAYAHWLSRLPSPRAEWAVHAGVLAAAVATLPIGSADPAGPAPGQSPNAWLLLRLSAGVGVPFFVLASASPLVQRWFGATDHRLAADPYFLYAVSNVGSLFALLGYPLLVEPNLPLPAQLASWSWGFGGFAVLALVCAGLGTRGARAPAAGVQPPAPGIGWSRRLQWIALAFVPSSLMLGVTQHLATDVASTPVLWVVPLAIYLSTFIAAFTERGRTVARWADRAVPLAAVAVGVLLVAGIRTHIAPQVAVHLVGLAIVSLACHGRLAADRPPPSQLTGFYLTLSFGGALGGAFNALLAPLLFVHVSEYPIALALACFLRWQHPGAKDAGPSRENRRALGVAALRSAAAVAGVAALFAWRAQLAGLVAAPPTLFGLPSEPLLLGLVPALGCLVWIADRRAFPLALAALLAAPRLEASENVVFAERTFFGVHRVVREAHPRRPGHWHHLWHGSTGHGSQFSEPPWSKIPTRYFTRAGPAGDLMRAIGETPGSKRVGIVGLGVGTLAAYGRPDWHITYFEIDPAVVRIARDPELFTYTRDSDARIDFILGDARLRLRNSDERYDALILDAFSSDAVPVHLLTRQAVELYLERLAPRGILAFQVTNLHLDLEPVLASIARDLDLAIAARADPGRRGQPGERKNHSAWVVLARDRDALGAIASDPRWRRIAASSERRTWTDDYSNVFGVLR